MPKWDEAKRRANIRKHGLDFKGCESKFDGPVAVLEDDRADYGVLRPNVVGWFGATLVHMTYVEHADDFQVISLRKAEKHEIKRYIAETS